MKTFIRLLGRCCTWYGTSGRYSSNYAIPFLGQMLSDIEEIYVLGTYIHYSLIKVALSMDRGGSARTYRLCWCVCVHVCLC